jgi:dTDP-3-amino-2,3,6-trideoxy-4-keto-D-glucose/dTDP-3-amino-3,4,6-trideoxy-alpha-D-glucose/dTDP-2,6-dideoxy-D-kanosamine transaminase
VVPVVDLSRHEPGMVAQYMASVERILHSGQVLLGLETASFEHELASWASAPHAVAVSSGASALQLTLAALDVGPGDEVIVPAFTAVPTASAVCAVGATPVFVDVERETACLDPELINSARTSRTKAVIVVHLYGRSATLPNTDLAIIEDAAQAQGALDSHDRSAAVAYSFYPTKNLGGIGDGGAIVSHDPDVVDRVRRLRTHGMTEQYVHPSISQNFRMSELEAAWLRLGLTQLAFRNQLRRNIAARYRAAAPTVDWHAADVRHVHHLVVARFPDRDAARARLADLEVATAIHYPLALTQQPAYRHFARTPCPVAEEWAAQCVTLPCFPTMTESEIEHVESALASIDEHNR